MSDTTNNQSIQLNKKTTFYFMPFSQLLSNNPKIPKIQREYIIERVDYFYNSLLKYLEENGELQYLNPIHVAELNDEYYIMDGQHRYMAYDRFYNRMCVPHNNDFNVTLIYKKCENVEEFRQYFIDLNNNFKTDDLVLEMTEMDTSTILSDYIKKKYPNHLSNSNKPKFPNIFLTSFVSFLMKRYKGELSDNIIEKMELLNLHIKKNLNKNDIGTYMTIMNKGGLFITYMFYGKDEPHNKNGRTSLPKAVRRALWERRIGMDTMVGKCFVCETDIDYHTFHCGHKQSVCNGGSDSIENLECICPPCNLSMNSTNMDDYMKEFHYKRYLEVNRDMIDEDL